MTLTVDVPEELVQRLAPLSEEERHRFAVAWMRAGAAADAALHDLEVDEETVAAIAEGMADVEAGRTIAFDDFFDQYEATRRK